MAHDKNKNRSYISEYAIKHVKEQAQKAQEKISYLAKIVTSGEETLSDAIGYKERGWDWKIKEVEQECEAWMNSQHTPSYLRSEYLSKARGSIPCDYYKKIGSALSSMQVQIYGDTILIDLSKDIDVLPDGSWKLRSTWEKEQSERQRVYLTDEEQEAYEDYLRLLQDFCKLHKKGWDLRDLVSDLRPHEEPISAEDFSNNRLKPEYR